MIGPVNLNSIKERRDSYEIQYDIISFKEVEEVELDEMWSFVGVTKPSLARQTHELLFQVQSIKLIFKKLVLNFKQLEEILFWVRGCKIKCVS